MVGQILLAGSLEMETSPSSAGSLPGSLRVSLLGEEAGQRKGDGLQLLTHGGLTAALSVKAPSGEVLDPPTGPKMVGTKMPRIHPTAATTILRISTQP